MDDRELVEQMKFHLNKIMLYTKSVKDFDAFKNNSLVSDACAFNISQLGELADKISKTLEEKNPQIEWRQIYGLRNKIVHNYAGVNLNLIWQIIKEDVPHTLELLRDIAL